MGAGVLFDWETKALDSLPGRYEDAGNCFVWHGETGEVTISADFLHTARDEPSLVIIAKRHYDGRWGGESYWTPDTPEEFWADLRAAERFATAAPGK